MARGARCPWQPAFDGDAGDSCARDVDACVDVCINLPAEKVSARLKGGVFDPNLINYYRFRVLSVVPVILTHVFNTFLSYIYIYIEERPQV